MFASLSRLFRRNRSPAPTRRSRSYHSQSLEQLETRTLLSGPEISVLDTVAPITSGSAGVIELGSVARGDAGPTRTFTVRNDGDASLLLTGLSLPAGFSIVGAPSSHLVPRSSDTFIVQLDSAVVGTHTGQIVIDSNDADESTFTFFVSGTVTANGPEIGMLLGDTPIVPGTQSTIPWPGVIVGATGPTRTFTIRNDGNQALAIGGINYPEGFALVGSFPAAIAPQSSDTFTIRLLSTTTGAKAGSLRVTSNDPDIPLFDFPVAGLVTATAVPSLTLLKGSTVMTSGSSTVDFGKVIKDQTGPSRTFTIRNDGTATLSLDSLHLPAGFSLVDGLVATINPAESDTLIVQLDSAVIAARDGDISIDSNDPHQSTFQFHVIGNVVANAPEIRVFQDTHEIMSGTGDPFAFDPVAQGKTASVATFAVANFGVKDLTLGAITLPTGFKLLSGLPATLPPDTFSAMVVQLESKVAGTKTGEISFSTNDTDENPFRILITGTVQTSQPEITVTQQSKKLTDGTATPLEFANGIIGQPGSTRTFTVRNQGRAPLTIAAVTVPAGFIVIEGLPSILAPHATGKFTVQLDTSVLGEYAGEITLVTNDADENPFNFSIHAQVGLAPVPQIAVLEGAMELTSGDSTVIDLGSVVFRKKSASATLTIRNDGDSDLNLLNIELPSGFILAKRPSKRIAPQHSATLQLRLDSRSVGIHSGQLIIHNDDAADPSFVIAVQGSVLG